MMSPGWEPSRSTALCRSGQLRLQKQIALQWQSSCAKSMPSERSTVRTGLSCLRHPAATHHLTRRADVSLLRAARSTQSRSCCFLRTVGRRARGVRYSCYPPSFWHHKQLSRQESARSEVQLLSAQFLASQAVESARERAQ
jgi:hypothetical protein